MKPIVPKPQRCAIYTRKSTEHNLDLEFNSLDAQNKGRLTSLIRLSYLAPETVGALLAGRHPIELTPTRLLRLSKNLPHDWKEQRHFLGFAT